MQEEHAGSGQKMAYGDTVILENVVNNYQFEVKFVVLK
jgi:hypothetical protein